MKYIKPITKAYKCKYQDLYADHWKVEFTCPYCNTFLTQFRFPLKTESITYKCGKYSCGKEIQVILDEN